MTLDAIPRWDPPTPDDVRSRMEDLASTLLVLSGMTRRGGVLPEDYRATDVPAIKRCAARVLEALEAGTAVKHPWDRDNGR